MTLFRHRKQLIARLLALTLLVAQFGAEAHADSHLAKDPDGAATSTQYCAKCLSFAPVTIAAGGMPHAVLLNQFDAEPALATTTAAIPNRSPCSAYQSRAPPQLL